ncbi:Crp/Fnr family transcriptional regulator [Actinomadura craniellae]|uniref:Crp/Fnr family transcriptional regulator n=1 Tax=Actinomadura craniellae TaxID=2231787 RepID=A0A365HDG5_9ACTN|nr:family 2B encapsulin nanocompartment shell protein [Actinomadura craniellae]RAY17170.1 Crp/Fnr family transcriptional regulator [Actinomadura craniellae]
MTEQDMIDAPLSLGTAAARNLASTTKSVPQMQGISSRWLLRLLPWVQVPGGTYRVNRRLSHEVGDGRVTFITTGSQVWVIPAELCELPPLRGFDDMPVLEALAGRFEQREYGPGDLLVEAGAPVEEVFLVAHGRLDRIGTGEYGAETALGVLADGDHFGDRAMTEDPGAWECTVRAATPCTALVLPRARFAELADRSEPLRAQIDRFLATGRAPSNRHGEASIDLASGHVGEPVLPGTFVDYEVAPREYELSVAQTVLRVHSRVVDLYSEPMDQLEQQLRLTVEALRERQEDELVNNREFGLLHNADLKQRIHTRSGPPTPDDLDALLTRRRSTHLFLAHPRAIAAFGRECTRRGVQPGAATVQEDGSGAGPAVTTWRGVPIYPCDKIPISGSGATSIMAMRTGESEQGVIGLHKTGIPDEYQPSLSVRFMGVNDQAVISYLVSAYFSAAVLVPDALGILENVEIGREGGSA